jgi:hypothetical protein
MTFNRFEQPEGDRILAATRDVYKSTWKSLRDYKSAIAEKHNLSERMAGAAIVLGACVMAHFAASAAQH